MTRTSKLTTLGLLATLAASAITPALADRASDQKNKNNARNLAIAGAAVAGYGLLSHNNTIALLGAAGAGLAGSQYEKDRKDQSQNSDHRYYYRNGNRYDTRNDNRNGNRYDNRDDNRNDNRSDNRYDNRDNNWNHDQNWDRDHNQNWNNDRDQNWNRDNNGSRNNNGSHRTRTGQNENPFGWNR